MKEQTAQLVGGPGDGRLLTVQPQVQRVEQPVPVWDALAAVTPLVRPIRSVWVAEYERDHLDAETDRWLFRWIRSSERYT